MCSPLWTTGIGLPGFIHSASPAVANGVVYADAATTDGLSEIAAFDAAGVSGCSGPAPKTCAPLWISPDDGTEGATATVANGFVYGVYGGGRSFTLRAFARPPG
jgi:hypothetical protein